MAVALRPISWRRWRAIRAARSMPSHDPATRRRKSSPEVSARCGQEGQTKRRQSRSTQPSSSRASALVPAALKAVRKGGVVVCGGIHMSDIPSFPYEILWEERMLRSVANLTRADAREFLALAPKVPVKTTVVPIPLSQANEALDRLRKGELT